MVVLSGLISRVTIAITPTKGLITPLITTHEPPSILVDHHTMGAFIIRIGFGGHYTIILMRNPPKNSIGDC